MGNIYFHFLNGYVVDVSNIMNINITYENI